MTINSHRAYLYVLFLLLAGALLWSPTVAQAQIVFDLQLSERGKTMVTNSETMQAEELIAIVGEHGIVTYEGERPVKGELVAYLLSSDGEQPNQTRLGTFELKPGKYRIGEVFSFGKSQITNVQKLFPDANFNETSFNKRSFFPCSTFHEKSFPDTLFDELGLKRGQFAFMLSTHADHDAERERSEVSPLTVVFSSRDGK